MHQPTSTHLSCHRHETAGRAGYRLEIRPAPEPYRSDLLTALGCLASGVILVAALELARSLWG